MAKRCIVDRCRIPARYAFLAVTGDVADRIITPAGLRVRACRPHLLLAVDQITAAFHQLPDGGPARIRAVELKSE
jgi:hypothetical protein